MENGFQMGAHNVATSYTGFTLILGWNYDWKCERVWLQQSQFTVTITN
jgi:hypothetical protein